MQRWRPKHSYATPPPKERWHRSALDWPVYCYEFIPVSRRDMLPRRSAPAHWMTGGRKPLVPWVPHLWRLRNRVAKARAARQAK